MAEDNVEVRITADVGGLNAPLTAAATNAQASFSSIKSAAAGVNTEFSALKNSTSTVGASMGQVSNTLGTAAATLDKIGSAAKNAGTGLSSVGNGARAAHLPLSALTQEARALMDEIAGGRMHNALGTAVRTLGTIASVNPAWALMVVEIGAVASVLGYLTYEAHAAHTAVEQFKTAADMSGLKMSKENIQSIQEEMVRFSGTGRLISQIWLNEAGVITGAFAGMRNASETLVAALSLSVGNYADMVGKKVPESASELAKAFDLPAKHGMAFVETLKLLDAGQKEHIRVEIESGSVIRGQVAMYDGLTTAVKARIERLQDEEAAVASSIAKQHVLSLGLNDGALMQRKIAEATKEAIAPFVEETNKINGLISALHNLASTPRQVADEVAAMDAKFNPIPGKIKAINAEMENAKKIIASSSDSDLIARATADLEKMGIARQKLEDEQNGGSRIDRTKSEIEQDRSTRQKGVVAQLRDEEAKWQALLSGDVKNAAERRKIENELSSTRGRLAVESHKYEMDVLDNAIVAAKRGSTEKIKAAQAYADRAKAIYGADATEYVLAQRKVIEAKNEASRKGEADSKKEMTQEKKAELDEIEGQIENIKMMADLKQISRQVELTELLKLENKKTAITELGAKSRSSIEREVTKQIAHDYMQSYKQIADSSASTMTSLLFGHETLRQAAARMLEQEVGNFIKGSLQKVAANLASQNAITAARAAGVGADKALSATTISGDAAKAGAGAYSAVVGIPIIGPALAPIAAATAFTAVEAFGSFDVGAWSLPSDMIAQVHQGEMIVPAFQSGQFRSAMDALSAGGQPGGGGSAGGDNHFHFHGAVLDGAKLARVVGGEMNRNPSLRPKY